MQLRIISYKTVNLVLVHACILLPMLVAFNSQEHNEHGNTYTELQTVMKVLFKDQLQITKQLLRNHHRFLQKKIIGKVSDASRTATSCYWGPGSWEA